MRFFRYEKGYTQELFAEKVDLNASYVSEIESGKYGPKFDNIEKIAEVLEVNPYVLFQETENTHKRLPDRIDKK